MIFSIVATAQTPIIIPSTSFSQPLAPANGVGRRVELMESHKQERLRKTGILNASIPLLTGKCPVDFVLNGTLLEHQAYVGCDFGGVSFPSVWLPFKRIFRFKKYSYCYQCGLPQDQSRNGEGVACHKTVGYGRGKCLWDDLVAIVVYCIWHHAESKAGMMHRFSLPSTMTWEEFNAWAVTEVPLTGEYYKALEVFIWFCKRWGAGGHI
jgi:hypothetical protein